MRAVAAPADKRFRRAHVSPARRRALRLSRGALARVCVAVVLGVYGVYRAADYVLTADGLTVSHIAIDGNDRVSRGEIIAKLDGLEGTNMLAVDLESWRNSLRTSPWVADATLRRVFPNTVLVVVAEREPMGIARLVDNKLYLVDHEGMIIDGFGPDYATLDLPLIDGLGAGGRTLIDAGRARLASRLLSSLAARPDLARLVSQIDVSDVRNAAALLKGDPAIVKLGHEKFAERLQSYIDLSPTLRERAGSLEYVDLRFDQRVYVRPQTRKTAGGDE